MSRSSTSGARRDCYPVHPALSLIPDVAPAAFEQLATDIRDRGVLQPVWLLDGMVVDGRARLRVCETCGIDPVFWAVPATAMNPSHLVQALNSHRIVLSVSQRAALAVELTPLLTDLAHVRRAAETLARNSSGVLEDESLSSFSLADQAAVTGNATQQFSGRIRTQLAEMLGVSSGYISQAARVLRADPVMFAGLINETCTLQDALRNISTASEQASSSRYTATIRITLDDRDVLDSVLASLSSDPRISDVRLAHSNMKEPPTS